VSQSHGTIKKTTKSESRGRDRTGKKEKGGGGQIKRRRKTHRGCFGRAVASRFRIKKQESSRLNGGMKKKRPVMAGVPGPGGVGHPTGGNDKKNARPPGTKGGGGWGKTGGARTRVGRGSEDRVGSRLGRRKNGASGEGFKKEGRSKSNENTWNSGVIRRYIKKETRGENTILEKRSISKKKKGG